MTRRFQRLRFVVLALVALPLVAPLCVLAAAAQEPARSITEQAFDAAEQLYHDGKWAEALAAFQKFETTYRFSTGVPRAIYYQGWCWFSMKRFDQAVSTFERLIKTFPDHEIAPQAMLKQAEVYREMNDFTRAAALYRAFRAKHPRHELLAQAMIGEAWALYKQNDLANAKTILQTVRTQFADDPTASLDALFLLGQILSSQKDYEAARAVYRQIAAQRANPRATEGLFLAGETMFEAKRYAEAITYYKRVQSRAALLQNIQAEIRQLEAQRPEYLKQGAVWLYQARMEPLRQLHEKFRQGPELRSSALFRIANCYQALGRPEEASVVYRHLLNVFPQDKLAEQTLFGLIQTLTERKQFEQAEQQVALFKQKYPRSKLLDAASFVQAESLFGSGQFQKALQLYQKFLTSTKDADLIETTHYRIAACYLGLGQLDRARDAFASFLQRHRASRLIPDALFRLGRIHFELSQRASEAQIIQSNLTAAAQYFEQLRANHAASELLPEVTFQLGYLYSYLGAYEPANHQKAVAGFRDFTSRWPQHPLAPEATYQTARNQLALGQFDEAAAAYRQLVDRHPDSPLAPFSAYEIAGVYSSANKPAEMIAALRDYVKRYPHHIRVGDALYAIGSQLENLGKTDEAIPVYRELISRALSATSRTDELQNAAIAGQLRIAALLEQRGEVAKAVLDCEGFLAKFSHEPVAVRAMITQIASLYRKAKMFTEAYAKLDQLATQYQQNATVRIAAASGSIELALDEGDLQRAYAGAVKLLADPERDRLPAPSYIAIGNTLLKRGEYAQARDIFDKALSLYGDDARTAPRAQLGLGQAHLELGRFDLAETAFNQIIAADPQNAIRPEADLGLARVYEATNRPREAVELYNKVMGAARGETAAQAAFRLARMTFAQKDYKLALAYYLRVALMSGGDMGEEAAYRAAQCHEGLNNIEGARSAYQSYLRRFPSGKFAAEARDRLGALPAPKPQA